MKLEILDRTREGAGGAYLEWLKFKVQATVPGFTADVTWAAMPMEFQRFRDELVQMNKMVPDAKAELKGIESGIKLFLKLGSRGQIQGEYEISNQCQDPDGPALTGRFYLDQTYLPNIISEVDELLAYPAQVLNP